MLYELYESEKTYVCNLDTILTTFLPALAHAMSYEELRRLVPFELEVLLQRHTGLLAELREQATSPAGMIGEIFCKLCSRSDVSTVHSPVRGMCVRDMCVLKQYLPPPPHSISQIY